MIFDALLRALTESDPKDDINLSLMARCFFKRKSFWCKSHKQEGEPQGKCIADQYAQPAGAAMPRRRRHEVKCNRGRIQRRIAVFESYSEILKDNLVESGKGDRSKLLPGQ